MTTAAPAWAAPTAPQQHRQDATAVPDAYRDAPAMPDIVSQAPREVRGWRARVYSTAAATPVEPATESTGDQLAAAHARPGHPDPNDRELWDAGAQAGNPVTPPQLAAIPTQLVNDPAGVNVVTPTPAPVRPRQGFTGDDNTREAKRPFWSFLRAFDQWAARHPGGMDKHAEPAPTASTPRTFSHDVIGAVPSPGGGVAAPGMTPSGTQPNSVRLLPRAWDTLLVNDGAGQADVSAAVSSTQRARGWRL